MPIDQIIKIDGLVKRYGDHAAVDHVNFAAAAGQCIALLGHNGAGKTTLMKLLLGLTRPTEGSLRLLGAQPGTAKAVQLRRQIGYLPENVRFHESMTGQEILTFYARLKKVSRSQNAALFDLVGLSDAASRKVKTYSKGMRQRLGLAQALLGNPKVLLLDEPTSGLDPFLRKSFFDIIRKLADAGTTILLSSHALTELEARTDRVVIMKRGRLVADGSLMSLRRHAGLPVRIRLAMPNDEREALIRQGFEGQARVTPFNGHTLELSCNEADKVETVRKVTSMGFPIDDIEILPPSLDEIYAWYGTENGGDNA